MNKGPLLGWRETLGRPTPNPGETHLTHCPGEPRPTALSLDIFSPSRLGEESLECPTALPCFSPGLSQTCPAARSLTVFHPLRALATPSQEQCCKKKKREMLERKEEIKSLESREFYNSHRFYGSNSVITFYLLNSFPSGLPPAPFGLLDAPSQGVRHPHHLPNP